jgi:hypothetical protein
MRLDDGVEVAARILSAQIPAVGSRVGVRVTGAAPLLPGPA